MFTVTPSDEVKNLPADHPYPFTFLTRDAQLISSHTLTGICEALIEGYADIEESDTEGYDAHLAARLDALSEISAGVQAATVAAIQEENPDLFDSLSEDSLTALMHPKDAEVLEFEAWPHDDVPLLLHATNYMPYSQIPAPEGDGIVWLNAHDERRFIESVSKLGYGELFVNEDKIVDIEEAVTEGEQ